MVDTTGISGPSDVTTLEKAAQLLEVDVDSPDDEVQSAYQDAVLETHPDTGGDSETFKAVDEAKDILDGTKEPSGDSGVNRTKPDRSPGGASSSAGSAGTAQGQSSGGGASSGFGGFGAGGTGDRDGPDREVIYNGVRNLLRENTDEETLKGKYGPNATMENVADILTDLIIAGGIELGDIRKMLNDEFKFGDNLGEATGGLFGGSTGAGDIFGGGGGLGSGNPDDYMSYGSSRKKWDDDGDDED